MGGLTRRGVKITAEIGVVALTVAASLDIAPAFLAATGPHAFDIVRVVERNRDAGAAAVSSDGARHEAS